MRSQLITALFLSLAAQAGADYKFREPISVPAGSNPRGVMAADLDGDSKAEVIVANFGSPTLIGQVSGQAGGSVQIFKVEKGMPVLVQTLPSTGSPRSLAALDLNGDGRLDLVATQYDADSLAIWTQRPDGSFEASGSAPTGSHPVGVAATQMGGAPLLAVANYNSDSITLYRSSSGGLRQVASVPTGANPTDVEFYSPKDGQPLLISANYGGNSLTFYDLSSPETPSARRDLALPGQPCKLTVGDVGQDKGEDLSVALFMDNKVAIFEQRQGRLDEKPQLVALQGLHPNGLAALDLGGARGLRLVSAERDSDSVGIVARGQGGQYGVLQSLSLKDAPDAAAQPYGPVEVASADFDGDGRGDLVVTHMRSGTLRFYLQARLGGPLVSSSSHPDPQAWYAQNEAILSWQAPEGMENVDYYVTAWDQLPGTQPTADARMAGNSARYSGLSTGAWYFHVAAVGKDGQLSETAHYRIGVTAEMSKENVYSFPNPSRDGRSVIRFPLAEPAAVTVRIYDETGALVWSRDLSAAQTQRGLNTLDWDGRNDAGEAVANGGYILQVSGAGKSITKKLAIIR